MTLTDLAPLISPVAGPTAADSARSTARRFTASALCPDSRVMPNADFDTWFAGRAAEHGSRVERVPFDRLDGWSFDQVTGDLVHRSGRFFAVAGLHVRTDRSAAPEWTQPIIIQPEVGVLGILVREIDGVLHCLMQAKMEPGNVNLIQLSPTVQATRSNYSGVHRGGAIRYLEHFVGGPDDRVLVDVLQSEQGSWFLHKRNRNMVVEATGDVAEHPDFCWLTIGQIRRLLAGDNLVNMDARTIMSCIPFYADDIPAVPGRDDDGMRTALLRSMGDEDGATAMGDVLHWLTDFRARRELVQRRIPLRATEAGGWRTDGERVAHRDGKYFEIVGVDVTASSREVSSWTQPLLAPTGPGVAAFVVKRIAGVLHILVQARVEAGTVNVAELAPTVKCAPDNYRDVPAELYPPYLDYVTSAPPQRVLWDVVLSEEGGRFLAAECRYLIVEAGEEFPLDVPPNYRWMTVAQVSELLRHCNYVNVEARSLMICLHALW